jgi:hypothetical protein
MNPSNPSVLARPLFAFCVGITMLVAAATYSSRARADVTFNLSGCTSVSVSGTQVTCVVNTGSTGSPTCSISIGQSPSSSAGGAVSLSANCSNFTPSSWAWTKNGAAFGGSTSTLSDSLPANTGTTAVSYTYGMTANGSVTAPSIQISVPGSSGGGGGGGSWPVSCPGFTKTLNIDLGWTSTDSTTRFLTSNYGGFGRNDAMVVRLTPPGGSSSYSSGTITMAEYGGGPITRFSTISTTPCDFSQSGWFSIYNVSTGTSLSYSLQVGGGQQAWIMLLIPGTPYYLNVKNTTYTGTQTCTSGSNCDMFLDFYKPPGT